MGQQLQTNSPKMAALARPSAKASVAAVAVKAANGSAAAMQVWKPKKQYENLSFLPELTDDEIMKQIDYMTNNGMTPLPRVRARLHPRLRRPELHVGRLRHPGLLRQPVLADVEAPHVRLHRLQRGHQGDRRLQGRVPERHDQGHRLRRHPPDAGRGVPRPEALKGLRGRGPVVRDAAILILKLEFDRLISQK